MDRLPKALEIPQEVVTRAVAATEESCWRWKVRRRNKGAALPRQQKFIGETASGPHAVIETERTVPSQITFCSLTGGAERWLIIPFDLSKPPISYIKQALEALPEKARVGGDGKRLVPFFGEPRGILINYSPDQAVRYDIVGRPLEILSRAYRPGQTRLLVGGKPVEPMAIADILGSL